MIWDFCRAVPSGSCVFHAQLLHHLQPSNSNPITYRVPGIRFNLWTQSHTLRCNVRLKGCDYITVI